MRQLEKILKPPILVEKEEVWTAEYLQAVENGTQDKHERWGHPQIMDRLHAETIGKCAYCEGSVADVSYPHVEHMIPKSEHPELAHRWPNLTWACQICNTSKGKYYHPQQSVLNPYIDEIDKHIDFHGGFVGQQFGASRGEITIKKLKLNRPDLVNARAERLGKIREMVERWYESTEPLREVLAEAIRLDVAEGEFTATVSRHLAHIGFPLDPGDGK